MARMHGNHAVYRNGVGGIGAQALPQGLIGWVGAVSEQANDVLYIPITDLAGSNVRPLGFAFQAIGGAVTLDFTLVNVEAATNPDSTTQNPKWWNGAVPVADGAVVAHSVPFSVMRVTFATAGTEFYAVSK